MKECVVVQDYDAPIRQTVCALLTRAGYRCLQANSPAQVWAILKSGGEVGVVLCGLSIDNYKSSEDWLVERMTQTFPDIPVVVLSECHEIAMFAPDMSTGAYYDYLPKPFEPEELRALVRRALEYRRLKLENPALQAKVAKEQICAAGRKDDN
jgi:DNA-binding NtrC family response regulator